MIPVKGYENLYSVTPEGAILSHHFGKLKYLRQALNSQGYANVVLCKNGRMKTFKVHRLVMQAYDVNYSEDLQVNHINGIKSDNHYVNLEMVTQSENIRHADRMGLRVNKKGSLHYRAKLTEESVMEIHDKYETGDYTQRQLAKVYNVSQSTIKDALIGRYWKHIVKKSQ